MKAYIVWEPGHAALGEAPRPHPGPFEALVRLELCVICNSTDHMIIEGSFPAPLRYPCVLGHESVGVVVEVGARVRSFTPGDRVTRAGYRPDTPEWAVGTAWGGFAEYGIASDIVALRDAGLPHGYGKQAAQVIPPDLGLRDAALLISLGETSSFAASLGDLRGKRVVILGTGIAGLGITFFAKRAGAGHVAVVGRRLERLERARLHGADETILSGSPAASATQLARSADVLVEATGNRTVLLDGARYLKEDGLLAVYGVAPAPYELRFGDAPPRFTVQSTAPDETQTIAGIVELCRQGAVPTSVLLTHEWPFAEIATAFDAVGRGEVVKGIVWINPP